MRRGTRQPVRIAVFTSGPVLDLEIKLLDIRQSSGHLCHGLRRLSQPLQGRVIGLGGKLPSQQILSESPQSERDS